MRTAINRIGQRYGKLVVLARAGSTGAQGAAWRCKCDCGRVDTVSAKNLVRLSDRKRCGLPVRHGLGRNPLFRVWSNFHERCSNPNHRHFHRYGGRGITVCREWECPVTFIEWALANGYQRGLQLDRRDNNRGYSPDNCRFVTSKVNNRNRQNNRLVEWQGRQVTLPELAEITGIGRCTLDWRIRKMGMPVEDAVALPPDLVATRNWARKNL